MKIAALLLGLGFIALCSSGCDGCGQTSPASCGACAQDEYCCQPRLACEPISFNCSDEKSCEPGFTLDHGQGPYMDEETCQPLPLNCTCVESNALTPGILGQHSALAAHEGTLMASGYESSFGDLVFFTAPVSDLTSVSKEIVDGVPDEQPGKDLEGWRGGVEGPGEDVGLDTDILILDGGEPVISYRDRTNRSLKFAFKTDGSWITHTVESPTGGHEIVGRYSALLTVDGRPALVYLVFNSEGAPGAFNSSLRWAEAKTKLPESPDDWIFSTIENTRMPCRNLCPAGQRCVVNPDMTSTCRLEATGCVECVEDQVCIAGECQPFLADQSFADLPMASGLFPDAAVAGDKALVVFYDRLNGQLKAARPTGPSWTVEVLDGADGQDVGAFCSLTVDGANTGHVTYQDMRLLTLKYLQVDPETFAVPVMEVIDDGIRASSAHPVGADSKILFDSTGMIRVIYQDALNADLLGAARVGPDQWVPLEPTDGNLGRLIQGGPKGYGFYSDMVLEQGTLYGSSFVYDVSQAFVGNLEFFVIQ